MPRRAWRRDAHAGALAGACGCALSSRRSSPRAPERSRDDAPARELRGCRRRTSRSRLAPRRVLELYALDSQLARTQRHARDAPARRSRRPSARQREAGTSSRSRNARRHLRSGAWPPRLRTLYEQGEPDSLASPRRRVARRRRSTASTRSTDRPTRTGSSIAAAAPARAKLPRRRRRPWRASASESLTALDAGAAATTLGARAGRGPSAPPTSRRSRRQRRLNARHDRGARVASAPAIAGADARPLTPSRRRRHRPAPPRAAQTLTVTATGYSLPGHTATGSQSAAGVVAVDPS